MEDRTKTMTAPSPGPIGRQTQPYMAENKLKTTTKTMHLFLYDIL